MHKTKQVQGNKGKTTWHHISERLHITKKRIEYIERKKRHTACNWNWHRYQGLKRNIDYIDGNSDILHAKKQWEKSYRQNVSK